MIALNESVTEAPVKRGKRWRVKVAVPGQGSSGFYSPEVLREYGPIAIAPGTKSFVGHKKPEERDPRDQIGTFPDGAYWDENAQALFAELEPLTAKWSEVLNEIGNHAEVSINARGEIDDDGNVVNMQAWRGTSVDWVAYAGLEGSGLSEQIESLVESARADFKPGVTSASQEKEEMETNKEILEGFAALKTLVESLIAKLDGNAQAEAQAKVDAEAVTAAVTEALTEFDSKRKVIEEAELLPSQREMLIEAARKGEDITPLVETAKKVYDEAKSLSESFEGRSFGSGRVEDWTVAGVRL